MAIYVCQLCHNEYDEAQEGVPFEELPSNWCCPVCSEPKCTFRMKPGSETPEAAPVAVVSSGASGLPSRDYDDTEVWMADIRRMAETGHSIEEAMRTTMPVISWDDILIRGAQLARLPLLASEPVSTRTVIGPKAKQPLVLESPVYVSHMSFGALSREAKVALAKGSAAVKTAMCSGEGGILEESISASYKYIFEYVPNRYGVTPENLRRADAIEIKIGQSAKPGMGGHLPGSKVTAEISAARGFPEGSDILSPARYSDITTPAELKAKIAELRELSGGRPIGVKFAAGHVEADLDFALQGEPDFITIDGRPGGTGSAPRYVKQSTSMPTIFALSRARRHLDKLGVKDVSLVITGGLRISPDFAKALAMGADAVAVATGALIALGCRQFRLCNKGTCPRGITSQDPANRKNIDPEKSAEQVANYLRVCTEELAAFARLTGRDDVHKLEIGDLMTANSEISEHTDIEHI